MANRYKPVTNDRKTELFDIVTGMKSQLEAWQASVERSLAGQDY